MSDDRKAVILGRLQRFTTDTLSPQALGPFCLLRSGRCPRSLDACTASQPPAGTGSPGKARVFLSPVCGPHYTRDARPPAGHQQMRHTCSPRDRAPSVSVRAAPAPRCARPPCGPEPFGSEAFSDPARPHAGPPVSSLPSRGHRTTGRGHAAEDPRGRRGVGGLRCSKRLGTESGGRCRVAGPGASRTSKGGATRTLPGAGRRGREGCDPGRSGFPGSGFGGRSLSLKGRAARVWKEDWTLVRGAGEQRVQERVDRRRLREV